MTMTEGNDDASIEDVCLPSRDTDSDTDNIDTECTPLPIW